MVAVGGLTAFHSCGVAIVLIRATAWLVAWPTLTVLWVGIVVITRSHPPISIATFSCPPVAEMSANSGCCRGQPVAVRPPLIPLSRAAAFEPLTTPPPINLGW